MAQSIDLLTLQEMVIASAEPNPMPAFAVSPLNALFFSPLQK
jgi:hypothetical protein